MNISVSCELRNRLQQKLNAAMKLGDHRMFRKVQSIMLIIKGKSTKEVASIAQVATESVRRWVRDFLLRRMKCFVFRKSPGRPRKLSHSMRRQLADILENSQSNVLKTISLNDAEIEGKILWTDKSPDWSPFLSGFVEENIEKIYRNKSHSAVLLIKCNDRFFAITFGPSGRRVIRNDLMEERFGLMVALNSIDPNEIKFADAISTAELQIRTTKRTSRYTNINNLGLALYDNEDLIAITGKPISEESSFATIITGADALRLKLEISEETIVSTLKDSLRLFEQEVYKDRFPFYEKLEIVTDGVTIEKLSNTLRTNISKHGFKSFSIVDPKN